MDSADTTKLFLAGGAVRDLLLGNEPKDLDFAFSGSVQDFTACFPGARRVGRSVDVWILNHQEFRPLYKNCIEADLLNRDFTINSLLLAEHGRLYAHPSAISDLAEKIIRPASDSAFAADPTRLFRLGRFAAVLVDFQLDADNWRYLSKINIIDALSSLPAERVGREVQKALAGAAPSRFLDVLGRAKAFKPWFAELDGSDKIPAGPPQYHEQSILGHTMRVMDKCAGDPLAVWMALCHDLGKTETLPHVLPRHVGHEKRGEGLALRLGRRLRLPEKYVRAGALSARLHMKAALYKQLRPATRVDLLLELDKPDIFDSFWTVVKADSGLDLLVEATVDLSVIKAVRLPPEKENAGLESGHILRQMRAMALRPKKGKTKRLD